MSMNTILLLRSLTRKLNLDHLKHFPFGMELTMQENSLKRDLHNDPIDSNSDSSTKKMKIGDSKEVDSKTGKEGLPFRKKKVAMMLVYSGKDYLGMQRNPGVKTIESELLPALVKAGVVTEDHASDPAIKMKFQRAARTDKGVSAAGQVCSLKMFIDVENPVEKINSFLPKDIKVLSIKRTTQGFDCKNAADARTYLYFIPTFAFVSLTEFVQESYRIDDDTLHKVNEVFQRFLGTHNFHNFTSGKKPTDRSATRYIMSFEIGKPFQRDGLEFAEIKIKGQSFMLHQIRKMIGMTIAIVRGLANEDIIDTCWAPEKVDVPKAPGLGLMLGTVHYSWYNKKFGATHELLEWSSEFEQEIESFKKEVIFQTMLDAEREEKSMLKWLETLHQRRISERPQGSSNWSALGKAHDCLISNRKSQQETEVDVDNEISSERLSINNEQKVEKENV